MILRYAILRQIDEDGPQVFFPPSPSSSLSEINAPQPPPMRRQHVLDSAGSTQQFWLPNGKMKQNVGLLEATKNITSNQRNYSTLVSGQDRMLKHPSHVLVFPFHSDAEEWICFLSV